MKRFFNTQAESFALYGHAYEIGINEMVIDKIDDYITKIEIPVASEGV